jgi:hypothetical protein
MAIEPAAISARPAVTDYSTRGDRTRQAGGQGKGNSQTIGHTDDDIPHRVAPGEMMLDVA